MRRRRASSTAQNSGDVASASTISPARCRSSIDSNSGTTDSVRPASRAMPTAVRTGSGPVVPDRISVSHAAGPVLPMQVRDDLQRLAHTVGLSGEVPRVHADVELGDVEPEQLDAPTQRGEPAVGDPLSAMCAQRRVDDLEVGHELVHVAVPAWLALGRLQQPLVHQPQLAPVRLVVCRGGDFGGNQAGEPLFVGGNGGEQRLVDVDQRARHAHRPRHVADFVGVAPRAPVRGRAAPRRAACSDQRSGCRPGRRRSSCRTAAAAVHPGCAAGSRRRAPVRRRRDSVRRTTGHGGSRPPRAAAWCGSRRSARAS